MSRPRILDLFCGAGGCSVGYHRAGFDVVGVDLEPQPNYPFEFHQADALKTLDYMVSLAAPRHPEWDEADVDEVHYRGIALLNLALFDAIHASPPCQAHSTIGKQIRQRFDHIEHVDLVEPTRELLRRTGLPYAMENVPGAPLLNAIQLCGSSFGLDVRRHRLFECSFAVLAPPCAHYWQTPRFRSLDKRRGLKSVVPVYGGKQGLASVVGVHGNLNYAGERALREAAMDIDWMTPYELTQAIPPAYTEHIGGYLMRALSMEAAA